MWRNAYKDDDTHTRHMHAEAETNPRTRNEMLYTLASLFSG